MLIYALLFKINAVESHLCMNDFRTHAIAPSCRSRKGTVVHGHTRRTSGSTCSLRTCFQRFGAIVKHDCCLENAFDGSWLDVLAVDPKRLDRAISVEVVLWTSWRVSLAAGPTHLDPILDYLTYDSKRKPFCNFYQGLETHNVSRNSSGWNKIVFLNPLKRNFRCSETHGENTRSTGMVCEGFLKRDSSFIISLTSSNSS